MARIRVGAIEIDGHDVRIDGATVSGGLGTLGMGSSGVPTPTDAASPVSNGAGRLTTWLATAHLPRGLMAVPGTGLLVAGVALMAASQLGATGQAALGGYLAAGALLSSGLGLGATAALAPWLQRRLQRQIQHQRGLAEADAVARLRPVLGPPDRVQTVECLARRARIPVASAVRALAWMLDEGEIVEEIDDASDDFYYGMAPRQTASLADRLQHLSRGV